MVEGGGLNALAVGVGGAFGALARYGVGQAIERRAADTLAVNVLGSILFGIVLAASPGELVATAVAVGFCGAFTTFSSFAVETIRLAEDGYPAPAVANAVGTLVLAVAGVFFGIAVGGLL